MNPKHTTNPEKNNELVFFLTAQEHNLVNSHQKRVIIVLAYVTSVICLLHALSIALFIDLFTSNIWIATIAFLFTFLLLVLVSRFVFLYQEKQVKNRHFPIGLYIIIHLFLCYILMQLVQFFSYQSNCIFCSNGVAGYSKFIIYSRTLKGSELKSMQYFSFFVFVLSLLVSLLPLAINAMFLKNTLNDYEYENNKTRQQLLNKISVCKKKYIALCSEDSQTENNPFLDVAEDKESQRETLLKELIALETALQNLF